MAMYQAKEEGKNTFRFFSPELNVQASHRMEIETDLRKALANGELELFYQPKIDALENRVFGMEGLIRWHHPEKGMINPGEFISIAEDCGLIVPLGEYVIETACRQLVKFAKEGIELPIAVNISMQQFDKGDFAEVVTALLKKTGADPRLLELEITESMAMSNPEVALRHINQLKEMGVRFAIDDFGTGYSNLAQLSRLPFDVFKIDRSFVMALDGDDKNGDAIVRTIIAMAHSLSYKTVAEGVETQEQKEALQAAGCRVMQGFLFAKPMALSDLNAWMLDFNSQHAHRQDGAGKGSKAA
jgi:EAL domain-containing protein (putative c-di-GMP-specific phosphodiesterase class I)